MASERIEVDLTELTEYTGPRYVRPAPRLISGDTVKFVANHGETLVGRYEREDSWGLAVVRVGKHFAYHVNPNRLTVI